MTPLDKDIQRLLELEAQVPVPNAAERKGRIWAGIASQLPLLPLGDGSDGGGGMAGNGNPADGGPASGDAGTGAGDFDAGSLLGSDAAELAAAAGTQAAQASSALLTTTAVQAAGTVATGSGAAVTAASIAAGSGSLSLWGVAIVAGGIGIGSGFVGGVVATRHFDAGASRTGSENAERRSARDATGAPRREEGIATEATAPGAEPAAIPMDESTTPAIPAADPSSTRASALRRHLPRPSHLTPRAPEANQDHAEPSPLAPEESTESQSEETPAATGAAPREVVPTPPEAEEPAQGMQLIMSARQALRRGRAGMAMRMLEDHAARYPLGTLAEERERLLIEALARTGQHDAAVQRGGRFLTRFPNSVHRAAVMQWMATAMQRPSGS